MHVGVWGLAAIVIVIASWLMYRYLAPQSWKEWTRAGTSGAIARATNKTDGKRPSHDPR